MCVSTGPTGSTLTGTRAGSWRFLSGPWPWQPGASLSSGSIVSGRWHAAFLVSLPLSPSLSLSHYLTRSFCTFLNFILISFYYKYFTPFAATAPLCSLSLPLSLYLFLSPTVPRCATIFFFGFVDFSFTEKLVRVCSDCDADRAADCTANRRWSGL